MTPPAKVAFRLLMPPVKMRNKDDKNHDHAAAWEAVFQKNTRF